METEVKRMNAVFVADVSQYNESLDGIKNQMKVARSETRLTQKEMSAFGVSSERVAAVQEKLNKQIDLQSKTMNTYKKMLDDTYKKLDKNTKERDELTKKLEVEREELKRLETQYGKYSKVAIEMRRSINDGEKAFKQKETAIKSNINRIAEYESQVNNSQGEISRLEGAIERTNRELDIHDKRLKDAEDGLQKFGSKAKSIGGSIDSASNKVLGLSASMASIIGVSAKMTMDFEKGIAEINTLLDDTKNLEKYKSSVVELSNETGIAVDVVSDGMYQAISSLGDLGDETVGIFETMTESAKAGGADVKDAVSLISAGMKGYGEVNAETAQKISDLAFQTAKLGVTTFPEMAQSMQQLFPLSSTLNVSMEELFGVMSTLIGVTGNTAEVSTQLKAVFSNLIKPTTDMQKLIKKYGYENGQAMIESKGLSGVLEILQDETEGSSDKMGKLFSSTEALTAILALTGDQYDTFVDKSGEMEKVVGATDKAMKKIEETDADKFTKSMNELKNSFIKLGEAATPMIEIITEAIGDFADVISEMDEETLESIVNLTAMGIAVGGAGKIVGGSVSTVGSLAEGLSKLSRNSKGSSSTIGTLGTEALKASSHLSKAGGATSLVASGASAAAGASGMGGLITTLGGVVTAAAPWLLAGAAIVGTGAAIHHGMSQEVIPSVDLFADSLVQTGTVMTQYGETAAYTSVKISEETEKQVGAYMALDEGATTALGNIFYASQTLTDEMVTNMTAKYQEMGTLVTEQLKTDKANDLATLEAFMLANQTLTEEEAKRALELTQQSYQNQETVITEAQARINEILTTASSENRELKASEYEEITTLQNQMKTEAVTALSEQEAEAQVILDRMTAYDKRVTAEMVSENIKSFNEQEQKSIDAANRQYNEVLEIAENLREEGTAEAIQMADDMIAEAERQRDDTIEAAKDTRDEAVDQIFTMNEELVEDVDASTGNIVSFWDKMFGKWDKWEPKKKSTVVENTSYNTTVNRQIDESARMNRQYRQINSAIGKQMNQVAITQQNKGQVTTRQRVSQPSTRIANPVFEGALTIKIEQGNETKTLKRQVRFINQELKRDHDLLAFGGINGE